MYIATATRNTAAIISAIGILRMVEYGEGY